MKKLAKRLAEISELSCADAEFNINMLLGEGVSVEDIQEAVEDYSNGGNKLEELIFSIKIVGQRFAETAKLFNAFGEIQFACKSTPMTPRKYGEMIARKKHKNRHEKWNDYL